MLAKILVIRYFAQLNYMYSLHVYMQINGAYISHTDGNDVTVTSSSLMLFPGVWSVPLTIELTQVTTPESSELFNVTLTARDDV